MTSPTSNATLTFSDGSPSVELPGATTARIGPGRDRHPHAVRARPASSPTTRASCRPPRAARRSPTSTATRASCSTAATRSSSSPSSCDFLEICYLLLIRRAAERASRRTSSSHIVTNHTMVNEQMQFFLRGFRRDAHPMAVMIGPRRRAVGVLSRLARHQRPAPPRDLGDPPDRQDADAGRDGLQVLDRPAVHVSEERPVVRRRTSCA